MNPILAGVATVVLAGAVAAASARQIRLALLGLAIALVAAPILADPIPDTLALAARILGAIIAAYLLWIATRARSEALIETPLGWPAEAVLAAAAAVVGWGLAADTTRALGPPEAVAAGAALILLSLRPITLGREPVRVGIGLLLLLTGALLARSGLLGAPGDLQRLVEAGVTIAVGAAVAWRLRADAPVPAR